MFISFDTRWVSWEKGGKVLERVDKIGFNLEV
jgi:hypothetical protein